MVKWSNHLPNQNGQRFAGNFGDRWQFVMTRLATTPGVMKSCAILRQSYKVIAAGSQCNSLGVHRYPNSDYVSVDAG